MLHSDISDVRGSVSGFMVPVVWSVVVVLPVLCFLDCDVECGGLVARRPGSHFDPSFTGSCGPSEWWLVILCTQQGMPTDSVNYRGEGFMTFLKVGKGDARG